MRCESSNRDERMALEVIESLEQELARADARIADMTTCALRNIPADWRPGYAWTDDCVMNVLSEYVVEIQDRAARADARIAELERDAERYRWLRRRIRLTNEQMMSGAVKKCLSVRVAYSAMDRADDPADSYLSQDRFNSDCTALDVAIDAARLGNGGEV